MELYNNNVINQCHLQIPARILLFFVDFWKNLERILVLSSATSLQLLCERQDKRSQHRPLFSGP